MDQELEVMGHASFELTGDASGEVTRVLSPGIGLERMLDAVEIAPTTLFLVRDGRGYVTTLYCLRVTMGLLSWRCLMKFWLYEKWCWVLAWWHRRELLVIRANRPKLWKCYCRGIILLNEMRDMALLPEPSDHPSDYKYV